MASGKWTKAKLVCDAPKSEVEFDFNPEKLKIGRKQKSGTTARPSASPSSGLPGGSTSTIFAGSEMPTIDLINVIFDGPKTKEKVEQLTAWMSPISGDALDVVGKIVELIKAVSKQNIGANLASKLPEVTFVWGKGFKYPCNVTNVMVEYQRFDSNGIPTRAKLTKLTLTWTQRLDALLKTNPTSGGPAGYISHIVSSGETIPSLAMVRYGQPGYWRAIAEVNGIDDPFRVQPGQKIFLPTSEELIQVARR